METLEQARELKKDGHKVDIWREVRYYAVIGNTKYELTYDWSTESLEDKLWQRDNPPIEKV